MVPVFGMVTYVNIALYQVLGDDLPVRKPGINLAVMISIEHRQVSDLFHCDPFIDFRCCVVAGEVPAPTPITEPPSPVSSPTDGSDPYGKKSFFFFGNGAVFLRQHFSMFSQLL